MKIKELLDNYYFHDSLVEKIVFENHAVDMTIDFCFWMQEGYDEKDPETGIINLHFPSVADMTGLTGEIDDYSILESWYDDGCITFLIMDDFHNISYDLKIIPAADEVEVLC